MPLRSAYVILELVLPGKHALVQNPANENAAWFFAKEYDVSALFHAAEPRAYRTAAAA